MKIPYSNTEIPVDKKWHVLMEHEIAQNPGWFYYEMQGKNNVRRWLTGGFNIRFSTKMTVNGIQVACPFGENITPDAHYGLRNRLVDVEGMTEPLIIRVWGLAASTRAKPGDIIEIVKMSLTYMWSNYHAKLD